MVSCVNVPTWLDCDTAVLLKSARLAAVISVCRIHLKAWLITEHLHLHAWPISTGWAGDGKQRAHWVIRGGLRAYDKILVIAKKWALVFESDRARISEIETCVMDRSDFPRRAIVLVEDKVMSAMGSMKGVIEDGVALAAATTC